MLTTYVCPECQAEFTSNEYPTECPRCGYVPTEEEDGKGVKGSFAVKGFGGH